ncbi:MAG TPA: helix-turn-helix domain-containing protein [Mycobacteriales bacterium]|nr:helix-turn-helix domain-containing protein [Mycobacteriales bacterium]
MRRMPRRFPAEPARLRLLVRLRTTGLTTVALAAELGLPRLTLVRVLAGQALHWDTADRVAVALGAHPVELWPQWFALQPAADLTDTRKSTS